MTIWEDIAKIIVNDVMQGLNIVLIIYIILYFVRKHVLPLVPKWLKEYRDIMLTKKAIDRATSLPVITNIQ